MRAKNVNTMYRRRSVRPDSRVYRQTRKLAGGGGSSYRRGGSGRIVFVIAGLIVVALALWLFKR
jgi:hypothetical protein